MYEVPLDSRPSHIGRSFIFERFGVALVPLAAEEAELSIHAVAYDYPLK